MRLAIVSGLLLCSLVLNVHLFLREPVEEDATPVPADASLQAIGDRLVLDRDRRDQLGAVAGFTRIRLERWRELRREIEVELAEAAAADPQQLTVIVERLEELRDLDAKNQTIIVERLATYMGLLTTSQRRGLAEYLTQPGGLNQRLAALR